MEKRGGLKWITYVHHYKSVLVCDAASSHTQVSNREVCLSSKKVSRSLLWLLVFDLHTLLPSCYMLYINCHPLTFLIKSTYNLPSIIAFVPTVANNVALTAFPHHVSLSEGCRPPGVLVYIHIHTTSTERTGWQGCDWDTLGTQLICLSELVVLRWVK